ncbi:MAG TPA: prolipoprotein diacylglyceryl transferase [Candidatus Latescibacteria bacterium]|nr:prolipoprotein diacylglyceryl transferase [Gemmatimonadota bacterium]HCR18673.1 prolipoprotein diacylglyceryl transferase [Candidatus Latescibacterota bacterium]|tara:strand:+ start:373 stop:1203 length:831 start_codon:yes stop_codon:yes gene_type:complete
MYLLSYIDWNVSPVLLPLGPIALRWYSLCFLATFVIGFYIMRDVFRSEGKSEEDLNSLVNYMVLGTLIGARLGHCLFYDPGFYLSNPLEMVKFWHGTSFGISGLSSHGGALGIFSALYIYTRKREIPYIWILDRIVIPTALGGLFIRLGNLFNSEIVGIPTEVPWAFVFTRIDNLPRHPAQLYESLGYGLIFVLLYTLYKRLRRESPDGLLLGLFTLFAFAYRFFIEFVKERQANYGQDLPLSVGQLLSVPLVILGIFLVARAIQSARKTRRSDPF